MNGIQMNDEIYPDDIVLRVDEIGLLELRYLVANDTGPAGICSLALSDKSVIQVDYAEPDRLISIEPGDDRSVLNDLIGTSRADAVRSSRPLGESTAIRLPGSTRRRMRVASSLPNRGEAAAALGQVALLTSVHNDHDELALVRGVAGFEAVATSERSDIAPILSTTAAAAVISRSTDYLLAFEDELSAVANSSKELRFELISLISRATSAAGVQPDARLLALLSRVRHLEFDRRRRPPETREPRHLRTFAFGSVQSQSAEWMPFDEQRMASARAYPIDGPPQLRILRPGRLTATWESEPEGDWLRVMRADSQVLLALVPIMHDSHRWAAEAMIPPELSTDDVVVDACFHPIDTDPSDSRSEQIRSAVQLGRQAVAAAISRQRGLESAEWWRRCSDAWRQLGDDRRADRALAYADGRLEVTRRFTVCDRVREAVDTP